MSGNRVIPILVITFALVIGGVGLFASSNSQTASNLSRQNLRVLKLSILGMSCAGCAASIENYVKAIPGVINVSVTFATKSGIITYDPSKIRKEEIAKNTIFDIYPPTIIADEEIENL